MLLLFCFTIQAFSQEEKHVIIKTTMGNMVVKLYDETPDHRDNFLKLTKEGFYDNQLFHRVINNFMIQTGDPGSKEANKGEMLGMGGPGYTIKAEFSDNRYHKKGALAAARRGDSVNPEKRSSGSQFYIVQGTIFSPPELQSFVSSGRHKEFTKEQIDNYTTLGGTPHLDNEYTVFGEVIEGLEVIDKIANVPVDNYNRPIEDIIISISIIE